MRNLFLFGPFLWLRRIVLILLVILVVLGLALFFLANSPRVIQKAADAFAGDYNLTYDEIKGNALKGIEIVNPKYNNEQLAKDIQLKWNPNTLPAKIITIDKLHLEEANVDVIKVMLASFGSKDNKSAEDSNQSGFDFTVNVDNVEISLAPFMQNGIDISKANLKSSALLYKEDAFSIEDLLLELDTNVTDISLKGSMKEQVATLDHIYLDDVNVTALMALFGNDVNRSEEDETKGKQGKASIFIPKRVKLDTLKTNILAFEYDPVKVKEIDFHARNISFDVDKLVLEDALFDINGTTNLSNMLYKGSAQNNHLLGEINLKPNNRLYELYGLPIRKEAIGNIVVDFNASTSNVVADVKAKATHILQGKKGEFNVDIESMLSHVNYDINTSALQVDTKAVVSTPYAKGIQLQNRFVMDEEIFYEGQATVKKIIGLDEKLTKPLDDLVVVYSGTDKSIETQINSKALRGTFESKDFKTAQLHLETIEPLLLNELVTMPEELKSTEVELIADVPLDFENIDQIKGKTKLTSNVANVNADVIYGKVIELDGTVEIPEDSLLKGYNEELKWDTLRNIDTNVKLSEESLALRLNAKGLKTDIDYALKQGDINGKVSLGGMAANISGNAEQTLKVQTNISSLSALGKDISTLYPLEDLPPISGNINATLLVERLKSAELSLVAPKLIYQADRKTKHVINDVRLVASMDESKVVLKSYKGTFNKQKYFSSKPARIGLGEKIEVSNLWINDELQVTGDYQPKSKKGSFKAQAKSFHIKDKMADIYANIDLSADLDGNDTTIQGKIILLKGKVTPDLQAGRTFASDSDIIILQEVKESKKSPFMDNLTLNLNIETKEALGIKQGPMNIRLSPDFTIIKDKGGELNYLGSVALLEGGTYIFQKKRFELSKSFVYFTGDINKPLLDMKANYQAINHLITIIITGTPAEPNINFTSSPSLTREQILSVILFDSEAGGDTHSGEDMMKMMGGAMAKAALSDVGIDVDHLAFGEGNSVEVGKKLTNKITVIYVNDEVPKVKLKYQHSKRTESVIQVNEESQSYDIIYKRDF